MLVQFVELWDCNYELTHSGCATSKQLLCLCFYLQRMAEMMAKGAFFFMICVFFFSVYVFVHFAYTFRVIFSTVCIFLTNWLGFIWRGRWLSLEHQKKTCNLIFEAGRGVQKDERKKPQHLWRPDSIGAEGFVCAFACVFVLINEYYSESRVCRGFRGHVAPPSSFTLHSSNSAWCI